MNFLSQFFFTFLYQPLLNILILIYNFLTFHDLGLAVIILTCLIRVLLHPLTVKSLKSQAEMQAIQPKIKEIQARLKGNQEAQARELMQLYQKEKVNPFSGCLPVLLQLPILIALYRAFLNVTKSEVLQAGLYGFMGQAQAIKPTLFFIIDLQNSAVVFIVALIAGILQFTQSKMALSLGISNQVQKTAPGQNNKKELFGPMMQKQMVFMFPVITFLMLLQFGALIGIYWTFSTLGSLVEQYIIKIKMKNLK